LPESGDGGRIPAAVTEFRFSSLMLFSYKSNTKIYFYFLFFKKIILLKIFYNENYFSFIQTERGGPTSLGNDPILRGRTSKN